jgi:AmmeMemoRadiSam system protein A
MQQPRAVFITLRRQDTGELRGCRGESQAQRPLCQAVALMAVAAGVDDPRFVPVTADELPLLQIEINALTPLQPIEPEAIEVGRHGLLLAQGERAGLLLPEVPLHYNWDRATYLRAICHKARLPEDAWCDPESQLYAFEAEVWQEETADDG